MTTTFITLGQFLQASVGTKVVVELKDETVSVVLSCDEFT